MDDKEDYAKDYKPLSIRLSDGSSIRGKVNLGVNYRRLSDLMKHTPDKFITLVAEDLQAHTTKVILVNKDYVMWAEAED